MRFYGKIIDGKPKIFNTEKYLKFFSLLSEGDQFEIKVTAVKDVRTLKMNNLYWKWLTDLSNFSGYTKRELHNKFKEELLCLETKDPDCPSTADLSVDDFRSYLQGVARLAVEWFSFPVLDPTDPLP